MSTSRKEFFNYNKVITICTKGELDAEILDYVFSQLMNKFNFEIKDINEAYNEAIHYCCNPV